MLSGRGWLMAETAGDAEFGARVREARELLRMSQEELSREVAGTTREWASRVETGSRGVSFALIPRLAEVLGVSTDFLFGFDPQAPSPFVAEIQRLETDLSREDVEAVLDHARILARRNRRRRA